MKRLLLLITCATALLAPATALGGGLELKAQTRTGVATSARTATGSCSFAEAPLLPNLTLRCSGSGKARAAYSFRLPGDATGTVSAHLSLTVGKASIRKVRSGRDVTVYVTLAHPGAATVAMVSISYYCS
jgi:hypothetical protein